MKLLTRVFNFYIEASVHVALSVYALTVITLLNFDMPYDENVCYAVFYGTIVGYNFIKYGSEARRFYMVETRHVKTIQYFSFICFALCVYYVLQLSVSSLVLLGGLVVLSFFYAVPFYTSVRNIRNSPGIKIFIVALVWSGVTVGLPVVNHYDLFRAGGGAVRDVGIEWLQRFLFVIVLTIPFEIRDMAVDDLSLGTIPQKIGIGNAKSVAILLLCLVLVVEFLKKNSFWPDVVSLSVILVLMVLALRYSQVKQNKYYCSFWVEGIPVLWGLLLLLLNNLITLKT
ncbi:hypothetical protein [Sinomicrobium weinanense]|uniref:Prenyltransferase n=1 Tax=Sinomicrobium weinanense TaxID=2842200 RepID=A0A926Q1D8_9FLAO|nr:hypothetical protein [Sinomicrobium weinanense]MBC9795563.1 hypothetical protein [Sinomicrobium weinanense]MBU3124584.1 hypothetical protein [Sinomicrobium weinanense]